MPKRTARANSKRSKVRARVEPVFAHQKDRMNRAVRSIGRQGDDHHGQASGRQAAKNGQCPAISPKISASNRSRTPQSKGKRWAPGGTLRLLADRNGHDVPCVCCLDHLCLGRLAARNLGRQVKALPGLGHADSGRHVDHSVLHLPLASDHLFLDRQAARHPGNHLTWPIRSGPLRI